MAKHPSCWEGANACSGIMKICLPNAPDAIACHSINERTYPYPSPDHEQGLCPRMLILCHNWLPNVLHNDYPKPTPGRKSSIMPAAQDLRTSRVIMKARTELLLLRILCTDTLSRLRDFRSKQALSISRAGVGDEPCPGRLSHAIELADVYNWRKHGSM